MNDLRPDRAPDWADTVSGPMRDPSLSAKATFLRALENPPLWLGAAMAVRNIAVAPFGLQRELPGAGHFLERMPVVIDTPEHYETGLEDKHLTFTIATRIVQPVVHVTTAIWFNSLLGRVYLTAVMPGHILATRQIAGRVAGPLTRSMGEPDIPARP
ncbi:DUF2867 domain-containing protein [Litoreibacter roseus]|uniref:DUF2867 domain-containing protein n=1 Tax=Litoreibacter roseus TaxID=2601869 RepID=A0A6N6JK13_9RHOB|nr:DUF2867 domain-containing protein [Litoreibacter roseus]GFE66287.1 hypothetical protein KIN_33610 [Litoreibacter roseus]